MGGPVRGQGGCEWRSEAFVKIQKKKKIGGGDGGLGQGGRVGGDQGGWEQRSEACVKIKKNWGGGGSRGGGSGGGGVRVDVNGEVVKLAFVKIQKKEIGGGRGGGQGGSGWGSGWMGPEN